MVEILQTLRHPYYKHDTVTHINHRQRGRTVVSSRERRVNESVCHVLRELVRAPFGRDVGALQTHSVSTTTGESELGVPA